MASQWKKRYQLKQQRRKVPSNRAALEEAKFFREQNTELTERMGHLINALSKWDVDVSWDGLRNFWVIELSESGRLKRDRVCKAEAENAELVRVLHELEQEAVHAYRCLQHDCEQVLESEQHFFKKWWSSDCENAKLRECLQDFADAITSDDGFGVDRGWMLDRLRELGIEV